MKNLFLTIFATACINLSAEVQNNAYIYFERSEMSQTHMCIIFDGHYYTSSILEHSDECPCIE